MNIRVVYHEYTKSEEYFTRQYGDPSKRQMESQYCRFKDHNGEYLKPMHVPLKDKLLHKCDYYSEECLGWRLRKLTLNDYMHLGWCMRSQNYTYNKKEDTHTDED